MCVCPVVPNNISYNTSYCLLRTNTNTRLKLSFGQMYQRKVTLSVLLSPDMRKVKKLPRAAFWGEKFPQKRMIHKCL